MSESQRNRWATVIIILLIMGTVALSYKLSNQPVVQPPIQGDQNISYPPEPFTHDVKGNLPRV